MQQPSKIRRRHAFTIVELLVVVAIITVLMAMLIPALLTAKMISIRTKCLSNIRGCGIGFNLYANDNNSTIVVSNAPNSALHAWGGLMIYGYSVGYPTYDVQTDPSYINTKIARCPLDPFYDSEVNVSVPTTYNNGMGPPSSCTYSIFNCGAGDAWNRPQWKFQFQITFPNNWWFNIQKLPQVPQPDSMMMLTDSHMDAQGTYECGPEFGDDWGCNWGQTCRIWTAHGNGGDVDFIPSAPANYWGPIADQNYTGGTANAEFYDGHAETCTVKQMRNGLQPCQLFWDQTGQTYFYVN